MRKPGAGAVQDGALLGLALLSLTWLSLHVTAWLPIVTKDALTYYLPWYRDLLSLGRTQGLSGAYANYTPPTLYLFSIASRFQGDAHPIVLLKLINAPFLLAAGLLTYFIGRTLGAGRYRAIAVGTMVAALPELWENAFHWCQYDLLFTTFLLAMTLALLRGRSYLAMLLFGSAVAFKLQAIFAMPALLGLLLAGELPLLSFLMIPLAYAAWMIPAAMVGRSWTDLALIYLHQFELYPKLSVDAPNFYLMIERFVPDAHLATAMRLATLLALLACGWLIVYFRATRKADRSASNLIRMLATFQILAVYLLPRMHERYFLAGGVFAVLLLLTASDAWLSPFLLQISALCTYHEYFRTDGYSTSKAPFILPFLCLSLALLLLLRSVWHSYGGNRLGGPFRQLKPQLSMR